MQIHEFIKNSKKKKAFTLIEVIVAIGLIGIIGILIFPSLTSLIKNTKSNRDDSKIIFALEEAIETSKNKENSEFTHEVNGIKIDVSIKDYEEDSDFKIIEAKFLEKKLRLVVEK